MCAALTVCAPVDFTGLVILNRKGITDNDNKH